MELKDTVKIAHLSDLHFGGDASLDAWDLLTGRLVDYEKPNLILITGDVVDTPSKKGFEKAKRYLDQLATEAKAPYFVCPGNHDLHWKGNKLPWTNPSPHFYKAFMDRYPTAANPHTEWFGVKPHRWRIRIVGVDTSVNARLSAKAYLSARARDALRALKNISDKDDLDPPHMVFLLMHHHLLPIRSLESDKQSLKQLVDFTAATNPGAILETLASSYVDLVLHGHEHARNCARYGSYAKNAGPLAVIAAGSATGMKTGVGWDVKRSSFNMIELRPDRSVWFREVRGPGSAANTEDWSTDAAIALLETADVRYNRFLRSAHLAELDAQEKEAPGSAQERRSSFPALMDRSEWQKHVAITITRDAIVRERRTNMLISSGEFDVPLKNLSGHPDSTGLPAQLGMPDGTVKSIDTTIRRVDAEPGAFTLHIALDDKSDVRADWMETTYRWLDAMVLTRGDFDLLDVTHKGPLRCKGLEFVAASIKDPVGNLTLSVSFPNRYAPPLGSFQVYHERYVHQLDQEFDAPLTKRLQHTGNTVILSIPFPLQGSRYSIAWRPVEAEEIEPHVMKLWKASTTSKIGDSMAKTCLSVLQSESWGRYSTVGVYIPDGVTKGRLLNRRGFCVGDLTAATTEPPPRLDLQRDRGLYLHAWWDEPNNPGLAFADPGDSDHERYDTGLLPGESVLAVLPIKGIGTQRYPYALLRVSVRDVPLDILSNAPQPADFASAFAKGQLAMLNVLKEEGFLR
jgi:predicted MPP superfamily phosphohydrolase